MPQAVELVVVNPRPRRMLVIMSTGSRRCPLLPREVDSSYWRASGSSRMAVMTESMLPRPAKALFVVVLGKRPVPSFSNTLEQRLIYCGVGLLVTKCWIICVQMNAGTLGWPKILSSAVVRSLAAETPDVVVNPRKVLEVVS